MHSHPLYHPPLLAQMIVTGLTRFHDRPCLDLGDTVASYREVRRRTSQFIQALESRGVGRGSAVAVLSANRPEVLYNMAALFVPILMKGGALYAMRGFSPDEFFGMIEKHKITTTFLVPVMIYVLLDTPQAESADMSSLETLFYGASAMSPAPASHRMQAEHCRVFISHISILSRRRHGG